MSGTRFRKVINKEAKRIMADDAWHGVIGRHTKKLLYHGLLAAYREAVTASILEEVFLALGVNDEEARTLSAEVVAAGTNTGFSRYLLDLAHPRVKRLRLGDDEYDYIKRIDEAEARIRAKRA